MTLPTISHPVNTITIPSLKKPFKFRSFLVKEEKLLLMAKESDDPSDILSTIKQIVELCSLDPKLKIDSLTLFDLEYIFLKLRSVSVDNISHLVFRDEEDDKTYEFDVDLNTIEVKFPEKINNNIKISDKMGIILKYPSASLYSDKEFLSQNTEQLFELIIRCVDKIYDGDTIYEAKNYKHKEISDFLENLSGKTFSQVQDFLLNLPKMEHVIKYTNTLGHERTIVLSSLNDFFEFR